MSGNGIRIRVVDDALSPVFTVEATGGTKITSLLDSISPVSGSLVVSGGVGIEKNVHIGGTLNSTSISSGSIYAVSLTCQNLSITSDLRLSLATIQNLVTTNTSITNLRVGGINVSNGTMSNLISDYASIGSINITGAINVPLATINSLFAPSATTAFLNVQTSMSCSNALLTNCTSLSLTAGNVICTGLVSSPGATFNNLQVSTSSITNITVTNTSISNLNIGSNTLGSILASNINTPSATITNINNNAITTSTLLVTSLANIATGSFGNVFLNSGTINNIVCNNVTTSNLLVTSSINATNSTINNLVSVNASIGTLVSSIGITAGSVSVVNLNSSSGTIPSLSSTNATITNLRFSSATMGNLRILSGNDIRVNFNSGNSQLILGNSSNTPCLEMAVLNDSTSIIKNSVASKSIFINTGSGGQVKFGNGNGTVGSTINIFSPSSGDTVGNTGIVAINGTLNVNNVQIFPNSGDIRKELVFLAANNQVSPVNITDLRFSEGIVRSFLCYLSTSITATSNLYAQFELRGLQKNTGDWVISSEHIGDVTGIEFTIISSSGFGQVQYTSNNEAGFIGNKMVFTAVTTNV